MLSPIWFVLFVFCLNNIDNVLKLANSVHYVSFLLLYLFNNGKNMFGTYLFYNNLKCYEEEIYFSI